MYMFLVDRILIGKLDLPIYILVLYPNKTD